MMRIILLFFLAPLLCTCSSVKTLTTPELKAKIDSANYRYGPSRDLLPPEFNVPSLENQYYCNYKDRATHVTVLRLRDNQAFLYETYYKPYTWARIDYRIGNYRISGDTIHIIYKPLLKGNPQYNYIRPRLSVSWIPPLPPDYLLLEKDRLLDPVGDRSFTYLTDQPAFDLRRPGINISSLSSRPR
jgi:hypothetical protein